MRYSRGSCEHYSVARGEPGTLLVTVPKGCCRDRGQGKVQVKGPTQALPAAGSLFLVIVVCLGTAYARKTVSQESPRWPPAGLPVLHRIALRIVCELPKHSGS